MKYIREGYIFVVHSNFGIRLIGVRIFVPYNSYYVYMKCFLEGGGA